MLFTERGRETTLPLSPSLPLSPRRQPMATVRMKCLVCLIGCCALVSSWVGHRNYVNAPLPLPSSIFPSSSFFFRFVRLFSGLMWTWRIGGEKETTRNAMFIGVSESAGFQSFSSLLGESDAVDRMCVAALHDIDFLLSPTSTHVKSLYNNSHETSDKNSILIFFNSIQQSKTGKIMRWKLQIFAVWLFRHVPICRFSRNRKSSFFRIYLCYEISTLVDATILPTFPIWRTRPSALALSWLVCNLG